ncbi:MAG: hypothetical protein A3F47_01720 [Candidatus Staskawiczbacteria bacterium RIFCSPHIGHO2_12_FULL_38_11]|uniref:Amino acid transporter transmembrane domain-containing protein n=1 Tax=Candidatus Staskawiczbacteria bacterium RIFCSPHIGHO2_12_FULL_38_11 TaxID=1802209 RepID=A0A1G2I3M2_9BACT|nr:MAG: hypothetical protein A3F47_01720 [Candidatus Staskawiczbacteria bacterium RIFCSPHIGHO2_12_FULL_38_11]
MKNLFGNYVYPVATLAGSIIGVGFLSLPFITLKVGFWPMIFYCAALIPLVVFIHVIFGKICVATPDFKRWPGFVGYYFGSNAKKIMSFLMIAGSFGVLLVYLIIGSQFLTAIFSPIFGGSQVNYLLLYFFFASTLIFFGVKIISKFDFWALVFLVASLVAIFIEGYGKIKLHNILVPFSGQFSNLFLPYGAIMFSLWGTGLIPETEEMVPGRKKSLRKIIIISILIPAVIYLLFIFLILGISGSSTTESALLGLKDFLGGPIISIALFIGVITTFTCFINQGLLLKKVFIYDMGLKEFPAWVLVCWVPLILFFLGFNSFIALISFVGGVLLSIEGILILLMYKKIGGNKIIIYPLAIFFIVGIIYSIVYFVK